MIRDDVVNNQQKNSPQFLISPLATVNKILSLLREWIPDFVDRYSNDPNLIINEIEDDISRELSDDLQAKAKQTIFIISTDFKKGADFSFKIGSPAIHKKPILLVEAKRLRPESRKDYVYNQYHKGGIERFKREQADFGQDLEICVMLGYVQEHNFAYWEQKVNFWIGECIKNSSPNDEIRWGSNELLAQSPYFPQSAQVAEYISRHSRKTQNDIQLYHFWLNLCLPNSSITP